MNAHGASDVLEARSDAPAAAPGGAGPVGAAARCVAAHTLAQTLLILALFMALRVVITQWPTHIAAAAYRQPVILFEALTQPRPVLSLLLCIAVAAALRMRRISWGDAELGGLRLVTAVSVLCLAWSYALYPFNHYLDQGHVLDRLILLALAGLVVRHPAFLAPFLWMLATVLGQFKAPIGYSWTDVDLVIDAGTLLVAAFALRALGLVRCQPILLALLVVVGAEYFDAARVKWRLGPHGYNWALENDIANLFVASHLNGWLPNMSEARVLSLAHTISAIAVPLQIGTFALEAAVLFIVASRRVALCLLSALIAMHIGILIASGIFFWKWIALDVALIATVLHGGPALFLPRWLFLALAPVIFFAGEAGIGNGLGWWDTRISQFHELWATTDEGARWRIDEEELAPYDKTIAQDRFFAVHDQPQVTMTLGATFNYGRFKRIQNENHVEAVHALIARGAVRKNERTAIAFDNFIRRFVTSRNKRRDEDLPRVLAVVSPWMHIIHGAPSTKRLPREAVVAHVEVMLKEVWYDGEKLNVLREVKVRDISIKPLEPHGPQ